MAGMFYSLKEAAKKLNKTESEVRQLAKDGRLREFRDGSALLFKIDEVEALLSDTSVAAPQEVPARRAQPAEPVRAAKPEEVPEPEIEELAQAPESEFQLEETPQPEQELELEELPELEPTSQFGLPAESEQVQASAQAEQPAQEAQEEEISLAPETAIPASESDITTMDTALTGQGVNVLGEGDSEHQVTDDSLAETVGPTGTATEASLEEIEEDVNLDSFGSGSGLLDLSLQADDTSLGGILDEIYTAEGAEEGKAPAKAAPEVEVAAEAESDQMDRIPEEAMVAPEPIPSVSAVSAMGQVYVEPAPDLQSNTFGLLLFLPLLVLLYTAIATVAAQRGVMPSIVSAVENMIWYIMIGAVVVAGLVVGAAFFLSGPSRSAGTKMPKAKKEEKPKKEKKAKKAKKGEEPEQVQAQ